MSVLLVLVLGLLVLSAGQWIKLNGIIMKLSELGAFAAAFKADLEAVAGQLDKATAEIIAAIGDAEIPGDVSAALEALKGVGTNLKTAAQKLDDLNPDAPEPPPPA